MNIATIALGYNHPEFLEFAKSKEVVSMLTNRPALGIHPPNNYDKMVQDGMLKIAPPHFNYVHFMLCGSCAVEGAFKTCFLAY